MDKRGRCIVVADDWKALITITIIIIICTPVLW
jgi:hypothetical protein